jgi:fatty-acid desaturase
VTKEWVAVHRKHHAKCETAEDPHSPPVLAINRVLWCGAFLHGHQLVDQLQDWCRRAEASGIDEFQKFARKLCSYASLSALAFRKVNGAIESKLARVPDAFAPTSP